MSDEVTGAGASTISPGNRQALIDTGRIGPCVITATIWPPGSCHKVRLLAVPARDLPAEMKERLRAEGCGEWVDEPEELIPLGEEAALGRPRNPIPVEEIVTRIKATPSPAERRRRRAEAEPKRYVGM
jgi:hypothetical protein